MRRLLLMFVSCIVVASAFGGELQIASRGKEAKYKIVIAKDADKPFVSAANEFQKFVEEITGVKLPIVNDSEPLPKAAVLIGPNAHSKKLLGSKYRISKMDDDSFLLKTVGKHVVVLGKKRGGQYGVYELLERFGGCRWYASWHSIIPKANAFSVPDNLNEFQKPAFLMREPFWTDMFDTYQALRNKCNGNNMRLSEEQGGKVRFGGGLFVHTFNRLMPPGEFFDKHPEYYSLIKGKRLRDLSQLCLSNPEVLDIISTRVLECIRKDPNGTMYSVSQNDWRNPCECENCAKIVAETGNQAGILIWFVNQVAERVEKEFPNVLIETLAYQYTREPPSNIKPRHNVVPRLCTIECDDSRPISESKEPQDIKFLEDIKGWSSMTDKLFIWDYVTNFSNYIGPFPNFYALQGNVKLFRDNHVIGLMEQGDYQGYHADFAELKGWILAKLLWNPDIDVAPLMDDFFKGYYGEAAPYVRQYFDELHELVKPDDITLKIFQPMTSKMFTDEFLERATGLWEMAEFLVNDKPAYLYNVQKGALTVYYAQFERLPKENISFGWESGKLVALNVSEKRRTLAKKLLERFEGPRRIQICEGKDRHDMIYRSWLDAASAHKTVKISRDGVEASYIPTFNDILFSFTGKDGYNYVSESDDGISFMFNADAIGRRVFSTRSANANSLSTAYEARNYYWQNESFKIDSGELQANYEIKNARSNDQLKFKPVLSLALALKCAGNYCYKLDDGPWKEVNSSSKYLFDVFTLNGSELAGKKTITIASPHSKRGMCISIPANLAQKVKFQLINSTGVIKVMFSAEKVLEGNKAEKYSVVYRPLADCAGLPASKPLDHGLAFALLQEDEFMGVTHPGKWADRVDDPEATDGSAIKMYNTHHEWCLDCRPKLKLLKPGVKYMLRARIKVEKTGIDGNAFWMGVYDKTTKKSNVGTFMPKTSQIKDGYQWYDIGSWIPVQNDDEWVWGGPGTFDKSLPSNPAIKAVYIDRIELVPVK